MRHITALSSNELQVLLCRELLADGAEVDPRGMNTRELLGVSFELVNPRNRLTTLRDRNWSPALAVAELAWNLRGDESVEALAFYTPRWRNFADENGNVAGSCYGRRIFGSTATDRSQWNNVKRLLTAEPTSRRAVMNFRSDEDVSESTNDLSCTNTVQFLIRGDKLHAFVNMRSNDAIWGIPYDVFLFTCLQELMAVELGVGLGAYHHFAASMHVYERHFDLAARLASSDCLIDAGDMPAMRSAALVHAMAGEEAALRLNGARSSEPLGAFEEACLSYLSKHKNLIKAA